MKAFSFPLALVGASIVSLASVSCKSEPTSAPPPPPPAAAIGGEVKTIEGAPVANARVSLTGPGIGRDTLTDSSGRFRFAGLSSGIYRLAVRLPGGYVPLGDSTATVSLSGQDREVAFRGQEVNQAEAIVGTGRKDTLALAGKTFVEVDASTSATPVSIKVTHIQAPEFDQLGLTSIAPAISIELGPVGGSPAPVQPDRGQVVGTGGAIHLRVWQIGNASGVQTNAVINLGTASAPEFRYLLAGPSVITVPNTGYSQSTLSYNLVPGPSITRIVGRMMGNNVQCPVGRGENTLYPYDGDPVPLGSRAPLIFIHGWQPLGISCGYFQSYLPQDDFAGLISYLFTDPLADPRISQQFKPYILRYATFNTVDVTSGFLAAEIQRLPLKDIVVIAHSMGGLVARKLMLDNGSSNVKALITLATPHEGTPVADAAEIGQGFLCANPQTLAVVACVGSSFFVTKGVRDVTTFSTLISDLKTKTPLSDGPKIHTLAGNYRFGDHWNWANFQYPLLQIPLPNPNDGFVPAASARPAWTTVGGLHDGYDHSEMGSGDLDRGFIPDPLFQEIHAILLATVQSAVPAVPSNLSASAASSTQVNLAWTDNASNEDGFGIERAPSGSTSFALIATVGPNATTYANTGLSPGTGYAYRVYSYNAAGNSAFSNVASATTGSGAPPEQYIGVWRGSGTQVNPMASWTALLTYTGGAVGTVVGSIAYPSVQCGGQLTLTSVNSASLVLRERITYGPCIDNGDLTLRLTSGTSLAFDWRSQAFPTTGSGTLTRANGAGTDVPGPFSGIWVGQGFQYNPAIQWSILLGFANGSIGTIVGSIAYPSLRCGGELHLRAASGNRIELLEDITYGNCVDQGIIATTLVANGAMNFEYRETATGPIAAIGSLVGAGSQLPPTPAPPSNLSATTASSTEINLAWMDNSSEESGVVVERAAGTGPFAAIAILGPDVVDYQDTGLSAGTAYSYRVRAFNAGGNSQYSNAAPAPPSILASSLVGGLAPPSELYNVEVAANGVDSRVATIRTASGTALAITDMALLPDGTLVGATWTNLYAIDRRTGLANILGAIGPPDVVGLAAAPGGILYASTGGGQLLRSNPQGVWEVRGVFGGGLSGSGDLAFGPDGVLYGTLRTVFGVDFLASIDVSTGSATVRSPSSGLGFANVWGLAFVGSELYGLTTDPTGAGTTGQLIRIDTATGVGTSVRSLSFGAGGAGLRQ